MPLMFDYAVIHNGVFYPANTPIEEAAEKKEPTKKAVTKNENRTSRKSKTGNTDK